MKIPGIGVLRSMAVTLKAMRAPEITLQYPEERPYIPERFRGRIIWEREICTGCLACERACPEEVILIDIHRDPEVKGGLKVDNFVLNFGLCSWCGLCVDACPTKPVKSIRFGHDYEFSSYTREGLIYANQRLYPPDDQRTPESVMPYIQPKEWVPDPKHLQHGPEDLGLERYSALVARGLINPDSLADTTAVAAVSAPDAPPGAVAAVAPAAPAAAVPAPAAVAAAPAATAPAAAPAPGAPAGAETLAEKRARLLAEGAARKAALDAQKGG